MFLIVFISYLCMCNSCRIGEIVHSVGHGPSVFYQLGHMLEKVENSWFNMYIGTRHKRNVRQLFCVITD